MISASLGKFGSD